MSMRHHGHRMEWTKTRAWQLGWGSLQRAGHGWVTTLGGRDQHHATMRYGAAPRARPPGAEFPRGWVRGRAGPGVRKRRTWCSGRMCPLFSALHVCLPIPQGCCGYVSPAHSMLLATGGLQELVGHSKDSHGTTGMATGSPLGKIRKVDANQKTCAGGGKRGPAHVKDNGAAGRRPTAWAAVRQKGSLPGSVDSVGLPW